MEKQIPRAPTVQNKKKQLQRPPEFSTSSSSIHKLGWYAPIEGLAVKLQAFKKGRPINYS